MQRVLLLILLLAPACGRREIATGNWTGVARPDATAPPAGPTLDEGAKGVDAGTASPGGGGGAPGAGFGAPDAAVGGRGIEVAPPAGDPVNLAADASTDTGDARSCPETGRCD